MRNLSNKILKIHSNCVFVHGYKNSILYDLYRLRYKVFPVNLAKLLEKFEGVSLNEILSFIGEKEFLNFLIELEKEDFIHFTPDWFKHYWLQWNTQYCYPGIISSAILNINKNQKYNIEKAIRKLNLLGCEAISVKIGREVNFNNIIQEINQGTLNTSISFIEIFYNGEVFFSNKTLKLITQNYRLTNFYINKIQNPEVLKKKAPLNNFFKNSTSPKCKANLKNTFKVNPALFNESLQFNTFYYKKIFIDYEGFL